LSPADAATLLASATDEYVKARAAYELILLGYYTEDGFAAQVFPPNLKRSAIPDLPVDQIDSLFRKVLAAVAAAAPQIREFDDQRSEYGAYISRADARLAALGYGQKSILQTR
jgi:hypothetical protein